MAYQALYRKWRPKTFDDVIGQNHIINTLKNEIIENKTAHAYLFTGTRGTGKTSTAKIFSRAVNCQNPQNGNPCNECDICKGILNESILDVIEIDAASNTGVDNIREIIEQCRYAAASTKYKIYIIDEVHMLSESAFNALLKTLEEPPEHVKFILATTEVHKVPATILSRCQRFDFKTIDAFEIVEAMRKILLAENIEVENDALEYVAFLGDGSMRDSLSILDRCIAYKSGEITYNDVVEVVGALDDTILFEMVENITKGELKQVLNLFEKCISGGKNPDNFVVMLLNCYREVLRYKVCGSITDVSKKRLSLIKKAAEYISSEECMRAIDILARLVRDIKDVGNVRVLTECTLVRLSHKEYYDDTASMVSRIAALENKIEALKYVSVQQTDKNTKDGENRKGNENLPNKEKINDDYGDLPPEPADIQGEYEPYIPDEYIENEKKDNSGNVSEQSVDAAGGSAAQLAASKWDEITDKLSKDGQLVLFYKLMNVKARGNGNCLELMFDSNEAKDDFNNKNNINKLKDIIKNMFAVDVDIKCFADGNFFTDSKDTPSEIFSNLQKQADVFPLNIKIE